VIGDDSAARKRLAPYHLPRYENLLARTGCDALTGALDRQSLEVHGRRVVEHAAAAGRHLALLLVDIDHFKDFNDRFGHAAGDLILKRIVLDVIATVRMSDFTYRFGGEEFVVIADGLNIDDAWALGERVRRRVAAARRKGGSRSASASPIVRATGETTKRSSTLPIGGSMKQRRLAAIVSSAARKACGWFTRAKTDRWNQSDRGRACPGHGRLA
jgi:diguanylate cyclase (GGDEF)-like protein